ncbi:putative signal peptide protein [Halorubrum sp. AJ67]|nr:putative signal peptide protein [Halorubrum sp. AJ67]
MPFCPARSMLRLLSSILSCHVKPRDTRRFFGLGFSPTPSYVSVNQKQSSERRVI